PLSHVIPDFVTYWFIDLPPLIYFDFGSYPVAPNLLNLLSLCVLAPVIEEIAFRGIILHRWAHKYGLRSAVLWSSLIFGVVHPDFLGAFTFGVGMCVLYLRTQSLLLPIICHGVYNLAVWLIEVGYILKDGPEYLYTLEQFQNEWPIGLTAGLIAVIWALLYLRWSTSSRTWELPQLGP
ncbi:MAG: CPBP family intramembrane glutamic endopeptidase, partial [Pseudomonadota bacterium]